MSLFIAKVRFASDYLICVEEMAMKNQILVEWLDSKDKGSRNRVNVKHIEQGKGAIRVGICVSVKFGCLCYKV
jgi:hypothetical protein